DGWVTRILFDKRPYPVIPVAVLFLRPDGHDAPHTDRIEAAERYYQNGLFDSAVAMLAGESENPMAALLEAYSLVHLAFLTRGRSSRSRAATDAALNGLNDRVRKLEERFPALSDAKVLVADVADVTGGGAPAAACRAALDLGLPLIGFGALRLAGHVAAFDVRHPRRALLEMVVSRRIRGWPWTAWTVQAPDASSAKEDHARGD